MRESEARQKSQFLTVEGGFSLIICTVKTNSTLLHFFKGEKGKKNRAIENSTSVYRKLSKREHFLMTKTKVFASMHQELLYIRP